MSLSVNTFETHPSEENLSFAFHERIAEGREIYFLAKFNSNTTDAKTYAESVFGIIVDNFEDSELNNSYDIFEESLKQANIEMDKRKNQITELPEIVVAFFDFHNLYLAESGNSEVYLIREGTLSQITENNNSEIAFSNILSGQIAVDDVLVISTNRILRIITTNQLIEMFDQNNFSDNVSALKQELRSKTNEDILISVIGVAKQEIETDAGFLSKVVPKKKTVHAVKYETLPESPLAEEIAQSVSPKEVDNNTENLTEPLQKETQESVIPVPAEKKSKKKPNAKNIQNLMRSCASKVKQIFIKENPQKKLIMAAVGIVIIFGIVMSVRVIGNYESEAELEIKQGIQTSRDAIKQANELLFQGDRKGANELLQSAEKSVLIALNSSYKELRSEARFLKADIERKKLEAENAVEVKPQNIADLGVKNDNIQAIAFNELRGNFYVNDSTKIFKTIRSIVENPVIITNQEAIIESTVRSEQDTIIFLTNTPRLIEYKGGVVSPMNTKDTVWKKGVDIAAYGSRYTYILDPVSNQIWKYTRQRSDYSESVPYNKTADLSRAISMTIDGNVFILSDDGSIQKLLRGENEKYEFRDLPSLPFTGKNLRIYTNIDSDFLYVLDPDNARLLIFQKGDRFATYRKQVFFNLPGAVNFQVNDSGQKVNILTRDKIFEFDL